ncbi:MAG: hypothetical protein MUC30_07735 [Bacteroidales bacterium]|nr:hypothetical protein [Bacteroidales bacterium]
MRALITIVPFLVALSLPSFSQVSTFGNFSQEEWDMSSCAYEPAAGAFIIFDSGDVAVKPEPDNKSNDNTCALKIDYFEIQFTRRLRIKVIDSSAPDLVKITFILKADSELPDKLASYRAIVAVNENGKTKITKYNLKNLQRDNDDNGNTFVTCFFDDISNGSIIDIEYRIVSNNFGELPAWNFYNIIPSYYSEYNISVPEFLVYENVPGSVDPEISEGGLARQRCSVWNLGMDGNYTFRDYEYFCNEKSYITRNTVSSPGSGDSGLLRHILKINNIKDVYGKQVMFIRNP